ncbi:MAG: YbjN domain-containing protein [Butyrivibrio sp.]|nr:YbjN domain-containing protein [Butyrivibrio sp.]
MDKDKIKEQRKELFDRLNNEMAEQYIPAIYRDKDETGIDDGILTAYFEELGINDEDAVGEFYFTPVLSEEDDVQFFTAVITLTEDVDESKLPVLYEGLSYLNFYLPLGAFSISDDHNCIIYKYPISLPIDIEGEDLYNIVEGVIATTLTTIDNNIDLVLGLSYGSRSIEDVKELIDGFKEIVPKALADDFNPFVDFNFEDEDDDTEEDDN